MLFSQLTGVIPARTIKTLLTTHNEVKNRNLIRQKTAIANGFESIEQAKSYFDRQSRLADNLWIERNDEGNICIRARHLIFMFQKTKLIVYDQFKNELSVNEIPYIFRYFDFSDQHIDFNYQQKTVTLQNGSQDFSIRIKRKTSGVICEFINENTGQRHNGRQGDHDFTVEALFSDGEYNNNPLADNSERQTIRIMAEIAMTCDFDLKPYLKRYQLTQQQVNDILATALYLEEQAKGYDHYYEKKPEKMMPQAMGYLAYIYLRHAYNDTKDGNNNRRQLMDSMSLDDENEFAELKAMVYAKHQWFLLSYCE